ncbi:MAG: AAA family ATPase [Planctomycetes bacterium]|nr:AAA family ATPase [Planctomycetota bacterium]
MTTPPLPRPVLIERLLDPAAYSHPTSGIRLVETHISWVILTGSFAYKIKKPVSLGFVDYSSLELRRRSCEGEVRVSGRFAPDIYVAAVPITGSAEAPRMGGDGEPIEWAVKLVQFQEGDRLDARFQQGRLTAADCRTLGEAIAAVEDRLPVARLGDPWGTADSVLAAAAVNLAAIRMHLPEATGRADRLDDWLRRRLRDTASLLVSRQAAGRIRECHGDLHLANIVLHDGRMTPFDAIEFSDNLRWIDVANDVAFLTMDLEARGRSDLAAEALNSWLEAADDHAAIALMPAYEAYRAIVRASIAAIRAGQGDEASRVEALRYLDLAERLAVRPAAVMVITCGLSGSGKSTVAAALVSALPAVRVRSDVERKRLAGMRPAERPATEAATARVYSESFTRRVYERLAELAGTILDAGCSVVVDAACTKRWQRDLLARAGGDRGIPIIWVAFDLPPEELVARVTRRGSRGDDPSDASAEVVMRQVADFEPLAVDEVRSDEAIVRVTAADTASGPEVVAERVMRARGEILQKGRR